MQTNNSTAIPKLGLSDRKVGYYADIAEYPISDRSFCTEFTVTYGDMHGNAMKVLWSLIHCGAASMDQANYKKMWQIYNLYLPSMKVDEVADTIRQFKELLSTIKFVSGSSVRFLGDIAADRGECDYFTLKILAQAKAGNVGIEILLSNHDCVLLTNYFDIISPPEKLVSPVTSFDSLRTLALIGVVGQEEISGLVELCYFANKSLKLVSYCLSENDKKIDIFMHAPNHPDVICQLARELDENMNISYSNAKELARIIDLVNKKFHQMPLDERIGLLVNASFPPKASNSVAALMFNGNSSAFHNDLMRDTWPDCVGQIIHGHVRFASTDLDRYKTRPDYEKLRERFVCYDNEVGKAYSADTFRSCCIILSASNDEAALQKQSRRFVDNPYVDAESQSKHKQCMPVVLSNNLKFWFNGQVYELESLSYQIIRRLINEEWVTVHDSLNAELRFFITSPKFDPEFLKHAGINVTQVFRPEPDPNLDGGVQRKAQQQLQDYQNLLGLVTKICSEKGNKGNIPFIYTKESIFLQQQALENQEPRALQKLL